MAHILSPMPYDSNYVLGSNQQPLGFQTHSFINWTSYTCLVCEYFPSCCYNMACTGHNVYRGYLFFSVKIEIYFIEWTQSVKDRNLFHQVDTIGNIFTSGAATSENITDGVHEMK